MEHIVLDAGGIIRGHGYDFHTVGKHFWSTSECIAEIRDSKSRHLLATLPFEIKLKTPSDTAMHAVSSFAKKTGDYAALSLTDLKLMALTYDLEVMEQKGSSHLKTEPKFLRKAIEAAYKKKNLKDIQVKQVSEEETVFALISSDVTHLGSCCDGDHGEKQDHNHNIAPSASLSKLNLEARDNIESDVPHKNETTPQIENLSLSQVGDKEEVEESGSKNVKIQKREQEKSIPIRNEKQKSALMAREKKEVESGGREEKGEEEEREEEEEEEEENEEDESDSSSYEEESEDEDEAHVSWSEDLYASRPEGHMKPQWGVNKFVNPDNFSVAENDFPALDRELPGQDGEETSKEVAGNQQETLTSASSAGSASWAGLAKSAAALPQPSKKWLPPESAIGTAQRSLLDIQSASSGRVGDNKEMFTLGGEVSSSPGGGLVKGPSAVKKGLAKDVTATSRILNYSGNSANQESVSARLQVEDDGVGWIGPSNISTCRVTGRGMPGSNTVYEGTSNIDMEQADPTAPSAPSVPTASTVPKKKVTRRGGKRGSSNKAKGVEPSLPPAKVALMTTDFSMQNVMMQVGLRVMSVDGMLIRSVKVWILRCNACFQVHYDMDRLFCIKCGANHLSRVAASVEEKTGELRLHLKKDYTYDLKGTKYSMPAPGKQGKYNGELLLREDQLLGGAWRQKAVKIAKNVHSAFGEDITSDVGIHINKGASIRVGMGKANPNAAKGRERRGKKKKSSK
jgi:rRNA maturation endonuclease Nob1